MCQLYYRPLHSWSYLITSSSTDMANKYHRRQLLLCAAVTQIPLTRSCQQHTFGKCLPPTCSLSNAPTCINMEPEFVLKLLTGGREKKKNTTKKKEEKYNKWSPGPFPEPCILFVIALEASQKWEVLLQMSTLLYSSTSYRFILLSVPAQAETKKPV